MRTIMISDIHGCLDEFERLLEKAEYQSSEDRFIFLGDAVDHGMNSLGVVQKLQFMKEQGGSEKVHLLLGNHEWNKRKTNPDWFHKYCRNYELFYENNDYICVHAGWFTESDKQVPERLLEDRSILRGYPELRDYGVPLAPKDLRYVPRSRVYMGKLFIAGHSPVKDPVCIDGEQNVQVFRDDTWYLLPDNGSIFIDTGCYMGNRLTALIVEEKRITTVSVPFGNREQ